MAVINVTYNDGNKKNLGYKSVDISFGKKEKTFKSGNFVKDWFDCIKFCILDLPDDEHPVVFSSSVDNFIMDGAPYDSAYLIYNDPVNGNLLKYGEEWDSKGIELFVPEGTQPSWQELKELCK